VARPAVVSRALARGDLALRRHGGRTRNMGRIVPRSVLCDHRPTRSNPPAPWVRMGTICR
jgi:hypothetical protein